MTLTKELRSGGAVDEKSQIQALDRTQPGQAVSVRAFFAFTHVVANCFGAREAICGLPPIERATGKGCLRLSFWAPWPKLAVPQTIA